MTQSNDGVKEILKFDISPFRVGNVVSVKDYRNQLQLGIITGCEVTEQGTLLYRLGKPDTAILDTTRVDVEITLTDRIDPSFVRWHIDIPNSGWNKSITIEGLKYRLDSVSYDIGMPTINPNYIIEKSVKATLIRAYWWDDDNTETDHHAGSNRSSGQTHTGITSTEKTIGIADRAAGAGQDQGS